MKYIVTVGRIVVSVAVFIALRRAASSELRSAFTQFGSLFVEDEARAMFATMASSAESALDVAEVVS